MDYETGRMQMISGQGEAMSRTYYMIQGNDGRAWFVPTDLEDAGDNVYCTAYPDWDKTGQGFSGAHLPLKLHDGTEFILKGGWHANAEGLKAATTRSNPASLFEATGVDLRQHHRTFVVIGRDREYKEGSYAPIIKDVLYIDPDEKGMIGWFKRGELIAEGIARALDQPVMCYSKSSGGSSCGFVKPGKVSKPW